MTNLISKIGLDKWAHFGIGGLICAIFTFVSLLQDLYVLPLIPIWRLILMPTIGTIVTLVVSIIKEYVIDDKKDWNDIFAALIGCVTVYIAVGFGLLISI